MADTSFWSTFGPGLLQFGAGLANQSNVQDEQNQRLQTTQGPLYNQQIGLAANSYNQAGSVNPQDIAAQRFAQQQSLVAPSNEADMQDLFRRLQAKGLLGVESYGAVPGTAQTPGQPVNPFMASLAAAQAGAKNTAAYQSLNEGEQYLNNLLNRGNTLNQAANNSIVARSAPNVQQIIAPSRPSVGSQILTGLAKNAPAIVAALPKLFSSAGQLFDGSTGLFSGLFGSDSTPWYSDGTSPDLTDLSSIDWAV